MGGILDGNEWVADPGTGVLSRRVSRTRIFENDENVSDARSCAMT